MKQERFTEQAQEAIQTSQQMAMQFKHSQWDVEHILLALLIQRQGLVGEILKELKVNADIIRNQVEESLRDSPKVAYQTGQIYATPRIAKLMQTADEEANRLKDEFISTEHLLIAMVDDDKGVAAGILHKAGITKEKVYAALQKLRGSRRVDDSRAESKYRSLGGYCGDAMVQTSAGEVCDDGQNTGAPGTCAPGCGAQSGCGDGQLQPSRGETCDDGNRTPGDGCDATCQIELG